MRNYDTVVMVDNKHAYRELNIFEGENRIKILEEIERLAF